MKQSVNFPGLHSSMKFRVSNVLKTQVNKIVGLSDYYYTQIINVQILRVGKKIKLT